MPTVVLWGGVTAEIGGVSRAVGALAGQLRDRGAEVRELRHRDWLAAPLSTAAALRRCGLCLVSVSRLRSYLAAAGVAALLGARPVYWFHGGQLEQQWRRARWPERLVARALSGTAEHLLTTNAVLEDVLHELAPRTPVTVVSPHPGIGVRAAPGISRDGPLRLVVAVRRSSPVYGLDLAIGAGQLLQERGRAVLLRVLLYGNPTAESADLRHRLAPLPWLEVHENLPPDGVLRLVADSDVLLRPTQTDGDSLLVREALAVGVRVVASDVAPRPGGVELAALDPESLASAVERGGRLSPGVGLGVPAVAWVGERLSLPPAPR